MRTLRSKFVAELLVITRLEVQISYPSFGYSILRSYIKISKSVVALEAQWREAG